MRVELFHPGTDDEPDRVVTVIRWDGRHAEVEPVGEPVEGLERLLRPTPAVVDDPSFRRAGTHGPTVLQPGDYDWFRAAILTRAPELGLSARFVSDVTEGGWDPAATYRTFEQQVERLAAIGSSSVATD
ncbi:MAG: hypothetical protein ACE14W_03720 [Candidatus Velamenicoccus archaeovorus]